MTQTGTDEIRITLPGGIVITHMDAHYVTAEVASSDPFREPYAVLVTAAGVARCQCKGFVFRGKCRHITAIKAAAGVTS